jgi:hypothetical protein
MKFTEKDLDRLKDFLDAHTGEEAVDALIAKVDEAFDDGIKEWAKKYAISSMLGSTISGVSGLEVVYNTLIIGMYLGARMQKDKAEYMTVFLKFLNT